MGTRKVKLGMTVGGSSQSKQYEELGKRTQQGATEEERLEQQGRSMAGKEAAKTQGKLPKVVPEVNEKVRRGRA